MAKTKSVFVCQNCGTDSPKWVGKCNACGQWNTFVEELVHKSPSKSGIVHDFFDTSASKPIYINEVPVSDLPRINTSNIELDRVLGGGMVPGSMILVGGEPGIGKSTLVLQMALRIGTQKVLYVSGEESPQQIKLRADRIHKGNENCLVVSETSLEKIMGHIKSVKPDLLVIDSIQTLSSESIESLPGSVSQIRECTGAILRVAKETNLPVVLIGHINKEGNLAGPKVLEHMVDVVLQFEGDRNHMYRILRSIKNRFGSTAEIGIFEMLGDGLREVANPSELLLSYHHDNLSGVAISAAIEGMRPFLIETQALVSTAAYGTPQRSATGFDLRRLNMLLAVLEKRAGFKLAVKDVFLNIAGGIKVNDPSIDLAVVSAILSSNIDIPLTQKICMAGEVGLSGEIRPVTRIEQRIGEAAKLGFEQIIIPKFTKGPHLAKYDIQITQVSKLEEAFKLLFA
ncbi:DNA replication and repair protein RadA [Saccharicrinis carchari]|uniref:DNA repair protein RadA n=1 Tax=Saccharicrinis carchari TaxID=1168039 RepID=A0A521CUH9_SACCC|nr:DNA repair protein RadA [Saccharicrinis carchari]SMO62381.1 DNA replication and repair protein RadA [Saccharicrinis carchari]